MHTLAKQKLEKFHAEDHTHSGFSENLVFRKSQNDDYDVFEINNGHC
jgi:hypothetical protein